MTHPTLRHATLDDVDSILELAEILFRGSSYDNVPLDKARSRQMVEKFIIDNKEEYLLLVSYDNEEVVGALAAYAFSPLFSNSKIAVEPLLYLKEDYRNSRRGDDLIDAFEYWAKKVGCRVAQIGLLETADPRLGKLLSRRGYKRAETTYSKVL